MFFVECGFYGCVKCIWFIDGMCDFCGFVFLYGYDCFGFVFKVDVDEVVYEEWLYEWYVVFGEEERFVGYGFEEGFYFIFCNDWYRVRDMERVNFEFVFLDYG